jgi:ADP-ribose pyrophosphatase
MSERKIVGAGNHLRLVSVDGWEYAERTNCRGVVAVVAVTEDRQLILTEQFRRLVERRVIDLPAGLAGDIVGEELEPLERAAQRELREETGYDAEEFEFLFHGPTSAGLTNEVISFFRAGTVRQVDAGGGDESENIVVHTVPLAKIDDWLTSFSPETTLVDPKVYAALHFIR